jgi:ribose transport system substrate-binding protein
MPEEKMKASFKYAVSIAALALAGSASAALADTPSWCGPKKATIALLDGFGGNSWR